MHDLIHGAIFILPCPIRGSVVITKLHGINSVHIMHVKSIDLW